MKLDDLIRLVPISTATCMISSDAIRRGEIPRSYFTDNLRQMIARGALKHVPVEHDDIAGGSSATIRVAVMSPDAVIDLLHRAYSIGYTEAERLCVQTIEASFADGMGNVKKEGGS